MTRLLINGQEVVLPDGFSFSLYSENPVFNKSSDYTYDITLSLKNTTNARIYQNINRTNVVNNQIENRQAILIVDNKVHLKGTEIILDITDEDVKIQLASGNSELSFLIGSNRKLRSLDLGMAATLDGAGYPNDSKAFAIARQVKYLLQFSYPNVGHQLLPYAVSSSSEALDRYEPLGNNFVFYQLEYNAPGGTTGDRDFYPFYDPYYSGQVPQPYLCFIIDRMFSALGYKLTYSALAEHPIFKNAYIVHGIQTMEYAKMLPDWTVEDFLSKLEFQFDCVFAVDSETKNVEMLYNYKLDATNPKTSTLSVLDKYTRTTDEENRLNPQVANIGYALDSDEYYSFMNIDPEVYAQARKQTFNTLPELVELIQGSVQDDIKDIIFTNGYDEYIAYDTGEKLVPRRVNSFRPLYNNPDSTEIDQELDIIPAAMIPQYEREGQDLNREIWFQIPIAGNYTPLWNPTDTSLESEEKINLQSIIEGSESLESDTGYTKMRLAIYSGLSELYNPEPSDPIKFIYPVAYVESLCEYFEKTGLIEYYAPEGSDPFRLSNLNRDIYSLSDITDTTITYKFMFKYKPDFNIRDIFIINNKKYVCNKIEKEVTINGFSEYIAGYFFPKE